MKKILILLILSILLSSGCSGIYNLNNFILPDDAEFLALIQELDTPRKACQYIASNFSHVTHLYYAPDPYVLWKIQKGDCNDFSTFAQFVANYHGYKTYQILILLKNSKTSHMMAIFTENGKYTYSNYGIYSPIYVSTFREIVEHNWKGCNVFDRLERYVIFYIVYDYNMDIIEEYTK